MNDNDPWRQQFYLTWLLWCFLALLITRLKRKFQNKQLPSKTAMQENIFCTVFTQFGIWGLASVCLSVSLFACLSLCWLSVRLLFFFTVCLNFYVSWDRHLIWDDRYLRTYWVFSTLTFTMTCDLEPVRKKNYSFRFSLLHRGLWSFNERNFYF